MHTLPLPSSDSPVSSFPLPLLFPRPPPGDQRFERALTWHKRVQVATDVAEALEYLHEKQHPSIVHKRVTAGNVLLDVGLRGKVSLGVGMGVRVSE